jgi:sulfatase maturation enzyme AslB (radical SAM superfamily)
LNVSKKNVTRPPAVRRVVALQKKYEKPNQRIENDLQTRGVLLNAGQNAA